MKLWRLQTQQGVFRLFIKEVMKSPETQEFMMEKLKPIQLKSILYNKAFPLLIPLQCMGEYTYIDMFNLKYFVFVLICWFA